MRLRELATDSDCAIAQALGVVGDWWTLLVVRDIAGGRYRFDELQAELGVSRKILAERLTFLVDHGVCERHQYLDRPPRYEYRLTSVGEGLMPVLAALQDWGSKWVLGDGSVSASDSGDSRDAHRVQGLVGTRVPAQALTDSFAQPCDPVSADQWTVLYCHPGAFASADGYPAGWSAIPGATGCTLEATTYRDRYAEFADRQLRVVGVSTQRPDQQAAFVASRQLPFELVSDQDLLLTAGLRLPTFLVAGTLRLKRLTLLVDPQRTIRSVLYPIADPVASVGDALAAFDRLNSIG